VRTINATTQLAIRQALHPIQRRFHTKVMQLHVYRGRFYKDTFFAKTTALGGYAMAQVYNNDIQFTKFFPLKRKSIRNFTAHPLFNLHGRTPYELVTGQPPDILEYTDSGWYDTVWYLDQEAEFSDDKRKLAKWLGVVHRVGQPLCYYLLPESSHIIVQCTVHPFSQDDVQ
jgi:hypothetical protein